MDHVWSIYGPCMIHIMHHLWLSESWLSRSWQWTMVLSTPYLFRTLTCLRVDCPGADSEPWYCQLHICSVHLLVRMNNTLGETGCRRALTTVTIAETLLTAVGVEWVHVESTSRTLVTLHTNDICFALARASRWITADAEWTKSATVARPVDGERQEL